MKNLEEALQSLETPLSRVLTKDACMDFAEKTVMVLAKPAYMEDCIQTCDEIYGPNKFLILLRYALPVFAEKAIAITNNSVGLDKMEETLADCPKLKSSDLQGFTTDIIRIVVLLSTIHAAVGIKMTPVQNYVTQVATFALIGLLREIKD